MRRPSGGCVRGWDLGCSWPGLAVSSPSCPPCRLTPRLLRDGFSHPSFGIPSLSSPKLPRAAHICTVLCCSHPGCDRHSFHPFPEQELRARACRNSSDQAEASLLSVVNQPWPHVPDFQLASDIARVGTA